MLIPKDKTILCNDGRNANKPCDVGYCDLCDDIHCNYCIRGFDYDELEEVEDEDDF